jgi:pyruvate dehydrogenase E1 component alpha subunit
MDVLAVFESARKAVERARKGQGPTLVECKTYRFYGSFEGDPQRYRSKNEREEWQTRDPLNFGGKLVNMGVMTNADIHKIDQEVTSAVEEAVKYAQESPFPDPEEVEKDLSA